MSVDKLVDSTQLDSDLTSVANAIRTKGGTSASLAFPAGFVSAINAISGGGGGLSFSTFTATAASTANTITFEAGDYTVPTQFALYLKSDVTAGDATNIIIVGGWALRQSTIPVLAFTPGNGQRYYTYKASGATDYYALAPQLTMSGTDLTLKFNNNHKFLSGSTYTLQIVELDSAFFV